MALTIEDLETSGAITLRIAGEVDLYSSPELRAAVQKHLPRAKTALRIDLSHVGYMDSSGVATLVEGMRNAQAKKIEFVLVTPSEPVMKVLQLSRLDTVFEIRTL